MSDASDRDDRPRDDRDPAVRCAAGGDRLGAIGDHVDQDLGELGGRHPHVRQLAGAFIANRRARRNRKLLADRHGVANDRQRVRRRNRVARIARPAELAQARDQLAEVQARGPQIGRHSAE